MTKAKKTPAPKEPKAMDILKELQKYHKSLITSYAESLVEKDIAKATTNPALKTLIESYIKQRNLLDLSRTALNEYLTTHSLILSGFTINNTYEDFMKNLRIEPPAETLLMQKNYLNAWDAIKKAYMKSPRTDAPLAGELLKESPILNQIYTLETLLAEKQTENQKEGVTKTNEQEKVEPSNLSVSTSEDQTTLSDFETSVTRPAAE